MTTSSTRRRRSSSGSSRASWSSSVRLSDMNRFYKLLGVYHLNALPGLVLGDLPLRGSGRRHGEEGRNAELLGHRHRPLEELLDPRARRRDVAGSQVDQLAGEPVPDGAPEVLLDQAVWVVRQLLALV